MLAVDIVRSALGRSFAITWAVAINETSLGVWRISGPDMRASWSQRDLTCSAIPALAHALITLMRTLLLGWWPRFWRCLRISRVWRARPLDLF